MSAVTNLQLVSDTGSSNSDKITSRYELSVNGVEGAANYLYRIQNLTTGGTFVTTSTTIKNGWMTYDQYKAYMSSHADARYKVQAAFSSDIGNDGSINNSKVGTLIFSLDKTVLAPIVKLASDTGSSNTDLITKNGTLAVTGVESGAQVQYSIDGGNTWTSNFSAIEGSNSVQVRQINAVGNVSPATTLNFTLDTLAPTAPTIALATDTGSSNADRITSNGAVTVTGTETGAQVQYSIDGGNTWTSSFNAVEGGNSVQVRQTDIAGNVSAVSTLNFTLDTVALAPTVALTADTGSLDTDGITKNGAVIVTGAETGAQVQYSTDGGQTWTGSFNAVEGSNSVQVRQVDAAGNVSAASSPLNFTLDTVALAPTVALASDTGSSNTDGITNNGVVSVTNTENGARVEYSIDNGQTWTSSFSANEGGNSVQVRQIDVAGNVSAAASLNFTLDTAAPQAPTAALTQDTALSVVNVITPGMTSGLSVSNSYATDGITSNGALTLYDVEIDASVEYSIDGGQTWTGSFNAVEGNNSVQVRQIDVAGNVSAVSSTLNFTLDTVALAPAVALATDTGSSGSDGITNNGALSVTNTEDGARVEYSIDNGQTWTRSFSASEGGNSVQVRQTDIAGNVSAATTLDFTLDTAAPAALTVALAADTGTSNTDGITNNGSLAVTDNEDGAQVQYSTDGGQTWADSFNATEGSNSVQVRQTDAAGNTSAVSSALSFSLDTATAVSITGVSNTSEGLTSSTRPTISGTAEAGDTVQIFQDGNASAIATLLATNGNWSFTAPTLSVGSHTFTAKATDVAGNNASADIAVTINTITDFRVNYGQTDVNGIQVFNGFDINDRVVYSSNYSYIANSIQHLDMGNDGVMDSIALFDFSTGNGPNAVHHTVTVELVGYANLTEQQIHVVSA